MEWVEKTRSVRDFIDVTLAWEDEVWEKTPNKSESEEVNFK